MSKHHQVWLPLTVACLGFVFLFWPALANSKVPAFRDGYHFYYPQAVWLDQQATAGNLFPSWNPYEGLGVSVVGQPSSALFYPFRILWFIPGLTIAQRYAVFALAHLLIAGVGIGIAAKRLGCDRRLQALAGCSYALCGPVFFQHTNLIYLCGAAWIGFVLAAVLPFRSDSPPTIKGITWFGFQLAWPISLMVLAGDAHTAVNAFLITSVILTARAIWRAVTTKTLIVASAGYLLPLAACAAFCLAFTSIQWVPTLDWARHSERLEQSSTPLLPSEQIQQLLPKSTGTNGPRIYDFSLSPWTLGTLFWANLGGSYLPENSRWISAVSAEGRMWIPSLYAGLVVPLLALSALVSRQRLKYSGTLFALISIALLAATGAYTGAWLLRQAFNAIGLADTANSLPRDPVGSLYWILAKVIPGYSAFRYPAKWTPWLSAGMSLLAVSCMSTNRGSAHTGKAAWAIGISSLLVLAVILFVRADTASSSYFQEYLNAHASDAWLGIPQLPTICRVVAMCLLASTVVATLLLVATITSCKKPTQLQSLILWITIGDLLFAASSWVSFCEPPRTPPQVEASPDVLLWADIGEASITRDHSEVTFDSIKAYQDLFLLGKTGSALNLPTLHAIQSLEPVAVSSLKRGLMRIDDLRPRNSRLDAVLAQLGVTHRLVRRAPGDFRWQAVPDALPFCYFQSAAGQTERASATWNDNAFYVELSQPLGPGTLHFRQFNDGQWEASSNNATKLEIKSDRFFVEVVLPEATHSVVIRRQ